MNDDPFVDVEIIGIFRVMGDSADESDDKKIYDLSGYFVYNDYVFLSGDLADKLYVNYDDVLIGITFIFMQMMKFTKMLQAL